MEWLDVKKRISLPILTPKGIEAMISSCLKNGGMNKTHSRSITMDDYRVPIDSEEQVSELEIERIKFDIIRYMAQSLQDDVNEEGRYIFCIDNAEHTNIDITKEELIEITKMSDIDMKKVLSLKSYSIAKFINYVYENNCDLTKPHNGVLPIYPIERVLMDLENHTGGPNASHAYNKRIYLNPSHSNISTYVFLSKYIKKCIDKRIPFDMKGFGSGDSAENELDGMILYSSNIYFEKHLECLEEIIRENPDIISTFGSPIYTGGVVNSPNGEAYYTIGSGLPMEYRQTRTYNGYIDSAINLTYLISLARLIKQYFPLVSSEYRELDNDTKELINKLNNLDQCSAKELQKIEVGLKEQKDAIRKLGYKILTYKKENGTEQENEDVIQKLKNSFSNNFELVCSILKFNDKEHIQVPIYEDKSFLDFEEMMENIDFVKGFSAQENIYAEKCPIDAIREYIEKLVRVQQEYLKSGKEIPEEMKIPQQIVLTPQNIQFLIDSEHVDYIGAGKTGNEIQFFWKKVDEIPTLEVRVKREENGKFYLTYIKEEASKEKDEFLWDRESSDGKKGMITVSKREEALEDVCDMDRGI